MDPDKKVGGRTQSEWDRMSLEELQAEWEARPQYRRPPYKVDRDQYARLTKVRSEIYARLSAPASAKGGKPKDRS